MKITRASDYALRILTHLACGKGGVTSENLAKELDIPLNHLAKLIPILARKRYLLTKKGKGGGLRLAVDPKSINLAEVIEAVEGPFVISNCIYHREDCRFSSKCKVRKLLNSLRQQMRSALVSTSVMDMAV